MLIHTNGIIKYYTFPAYEGQGLYHAVFTRHGGSSPAPWNSLNFGASVGDDIQRVIKNRQIALESIEVSSESVYDLHQVHSSDVIVVNRPKDTDEAHLKADAMITNHPNITLMMRFADCVPILLFDPVNRAIGLVHAGWLGTVERIVEKTINMMKVEFGTIPSHIIAGIGPSIGPDHYSIREDVALRIRASFGDKTDLVLLHNKEIMFFDLWMANEIILRDTGIDKINHAGICTQCNIDDWYSHRGEAGRTGRFGVVLGINN